MSAGRDRRRQRRPSPAQRNLTNVFGPLDGARIPGGCDYCDAYQTVVPGGVGIWHMTTHHDDWCPWLAARGES